VIPRKPENSRGVRKENLAWRFWEMKNTLTFRLNLPIDETKLEKHIICFSYSLSPTCSSMRMTYLTYVHICFCKVDLTSSAKTHS
jgi:hypothetical protein